MSDAGGLLSIDDALGRVLERAAPLPPELVPVAEAAGRILAAPARAAIDLPPFPSSAMDGYAVRAADAPGTLPVVARIAAGRPAGARLGPGEAMAIATGGVVPDGADTVVPLERVVSHDNTIEIPSAVTVGANVRLPGRDARAGDVIVPAGVPVRPAQVGALAAAGLAELSCARRPVLALVSTGTELRVPGEPLGPGEIYESNGAMLAAAATSVGAIVMRAATVADDEAAHREALARALDADVLVTTGGVSVGPHDLVRGVARGLGVEEVFWGVAVRPGKPVAFGVARRTLVFGLPGNPVSSLVGFELFVRPALAALQGATAPGPHWEWGVLASALTRNAGRDELVRASARPTATGVLLEPVVGQESHMIARAAAAEALVLVPRGTGQVADGSALRYLRLD